LAPISLPDLLAAAALQTRFDRKYIIPADQLGPFVTALAHQAQILEIDGARGFRYESVYFDTPDLLSYHLTARRRRRRFKIRSRSYLDSGGCWLEVKVPGPRGRTVKHRIEHPAQLGSELGPGLPFVASTLAAEGIHLPVPAALRPVLTTRYRRSTLYLPASASRLTIDTELTWLHGAAGWHLPTVAVVEVKTTGATSLADRLLWARQCRPARISKYATGLAALRPELPAGPWRQTLRQRLPRPDAPVPYRSA
jgi:hypothetical protein